MKHTRFRMVWVTSGWPPEVGGPSSGNPARARWFDSHGDIDLTVVAPRDEDGSVHAAGVKRVIGYDASPWQPYPLFRTPTLRGGRQIAATVAEYEPHIILNADIERGFLFSAWRLPARQWARSRGIPYVGYYHTDFYGFAETYPGWKHVRGVALRAPIARLYRSLDSTLTASASAEAQVQGFGAQNVVCMPFDGVDTTEFDPGNRRPDVATARFGAESGPHVLTMGRIAPEKRIDLTIEAVSALQKDGYPMATLVVAGDGPGRLPDQLRQKAAAELKPGTWEFTGFVHGAERRELVASADVLSLPSPHETFAITATEAMASGTPVVCADSGAPPNYVVDGQNGYLVAPNSTEALAGGVARALQQGRDAVGPAARSTVVRQFSMGAICEGLHDYFITAITRGEFRAPNQAALPDPRS